MKTKILKNEKVNQLYHDARAFLGENLKMKDSYFLDHWEYIKQYVDRWGMEGPDGLVAFAAMKMEQLRTQKTPPKRALLSSICNRVRHFTKFLIFIFITVIFY